MGDQRKKERKRIVVKVGSSSLTAKSGGLSIPQLSEFAADVTKLKQQGHEIVIVSSGAVAAGYQALGYPHRPVTMEGKQAASAVGQGLLMQAYNDYFRKNEQVAAQILLTRSDFSDGERYRNAYNTLSLLLKRGVIPIINENDTVSVHELTFGDNDMLSALVAGLIHADLLLICTDTNGLYTSNPSVNPDAQRIDVVTDITPELEAMAGGSGSKVGTGGMKSKLEAAKRALAVGVEVFVGKRSNEHSLLKVLEGKGDGTYFEASALPLQTRKQWIGYHSPIGGRFVVDTGAKEALLYRNKSLLLPGLKEVAGRFLKGDVVEVVDEEGTLLGRGRTQFDYTDIEKLLENRSQGKGTVLKEMIHRDHWVSVGRLNGDE